MIIIKKMRKILRFKKKCVYCNVIKKGGIMKRM